MPVYVDKPVHRYGRMHMCHMIADTEEELHEMADTIGIKRKWFQNEGNYPHYDICASKRKEAIQAGAIHLERKGFTKVLRRIKRI